MNKVLIFIAIVIFTVSCSTTHKYSQNNAVFSSNAPGGNLDMTKQSSDRMIITTGQVRIIVKSIDTATAQINRIVLGMQGYVQSASTYGVVVRIPADKLNTAMSDFSKLGKVSYRSLSSKDVTDSYKDNSIKLENYEKVRQRYFELLAKANNVTETVLIEKEIERLTLEIELLKGQLKRYDNQIAYTSIDIQLTQKIKPGVLAYFFVGIYKGVRWLFVR